MSFPHGPGVLWLLLTVLLGAAVSAQGAPNLAQDATVTVDSSFNGYGHAVLTDGKWVELGKETTFDTGRPDRLGNAGNTWVSAAGEGVEHWVRLDWPQAVEINRVSLWWATPEWYPRAFRLEYLSDANWTSLTGPTDWFVATDQHSVITFAPRQARAVRLVQHPSGGPERGLLAVQELAAYHQPEAAEGATGASLLTAEQLQRLTPGKLERNLARLGEQQPGASEAREWLDDAISVAVPEFADGDTDLPLLLHPGHMPGVKWPIQHVLDGGAVFFAGAPPVAASLKPQVYDGERWIPLSAGLKVARDAARRCLSFTCEPVATTALRFVLAPAWTAVTEVEVFRYLPAGPNVWPERLVKGNQYEKALLASKQEPSYATLCMAALSMVPARALLGLKDTHPEIGVTWDGEVLSRWPLRFAFGERRETLAQFRDTVTRTLVDGWRPGTIVRGRMGDLRLTQTAFVTFAGAERTKPVLFAHLELENLAKTPLSTSLATTVHVPAGSVRTEAGVALADERVVLVGPPGGQVGKAAGVLVTPLELPARGKASVDLVQPFGQPGSPDDVPLYRALGFRRALASFRGYWDEILAPAAVMDVPEAHVRNMYRAVLAQLFINADGSIMPYGADPGVYSGNLYGVEEGYAMMALAEAGYLADAQRYMDGTYLTPQFLVKVERYTKYADRHQQYRNGLQPHYAVSAYRLSRNQAWIQKHVPLLRQCAEWTIAQRRRTMVLEDGQKPLHWGLLPKWSFGGDISELQCYALYANFACWKGLVDTAWLLDDLGDHETATRYRQEAADYRTCIDRAVEGNYLPGHKPPFLPLQLYAKEPVGDDYDQLFIGTVLHLQAMDPDGQQVRYLTDFMEQDNRAFCLLPRFRRDAGAGGLDGLYGLGYLLSKLHQDRIPEFLLGFYGYLALNLERGTFASRETNLIYASDLHVRSKYPVPDMSDPVPCSAAVAVQFLRNMLVTEAPPRDGQPSQELRLLWGTPRAWFGDGKDIVVRRAPTEYGEVEVHVVSHAAKGRIEAVIEPPTRNLWEKLVLRLRHPEGRQWRRVVVNGGAATELDARRELVILRPGAAKYQVVAEY